MLESLFENKQKVVVYFPSVKLDTYSVEDFLNELFDLVAAFLEPVKFGVHKNDILDYLKQESQCGKRLLDFLADKRYIATDDSFLRLAKKYTFLSNINSQSMMFYKGEFVLGDGEDVVDLIERIASVMKDGSYINLFTKELFPND